MLMQGPTARNHKGHSGAGPGICAGQDFAWFEDFFLASQMLPRDFVWELLPPTRNGYRLLPQSKDCATWLYAAFCF